MKTWILALYAFLVLLPSVQAVADKPIRKTLTINLRQHSAKITKPNIVAPGGMEVNSFTGNLFTQRYDQCTPARGFSLDVTFSYNSGLSKHNWGMGNGWTSTFNMMYEATPGHIIIRGPDGSKDSFAVSGGTYTAPPGVFATLSEYAPGKYLWRSRTGHRILFDDASHKRVTSIEDRNGNTITFADFIGGQPTRMTDANGRSIRLNWSAGRLVSLVDSIASPPRTTSYQYDARGNLKTVTYPMGYVFQYRYDARSRMVAFTDELSNTVNIAYTSSGAVSSITTPGSPDTPPTSLTFDYNPGSHQTIATEIVAGAPQSTTYTFDALKRLVRIQGSAGLDEQFEYNAQYDITRFINSNGHATDNTWDASGNLLSSTNALGQTMSWTYEPVYCNVLSATDRMGNVTSYSYDANGNLLTASAPLGVGYSCVWDAHGDLVSSTDPLLNVTTYTHDGNGYLTSIAHPIGSESFSYDNSGNLISYTDANGNTTVMTYDLLNRRTSMADALGGNKVYLYGGLDNLIQVTDENGHSTSYAYDALKRVVSMTRPEGVTLVARDEYGNIRQSTDFNGNMRSYNYDTRNRPIGMTDPLGHSSSVTYDNNGNVLSSTDFNGHTTLYQYDVTDRRIGVTDALGNPTVYVLDANDNPISVTDANLHSTTYVYDALNRMTQINHPIGTEAFTYDLNSNLLSHTDPNGHVEEYTYDAMHRRVSILNPLLQTVTFSYDPSGNMISCTDPGGLTRSFTYDALHRTISSTNPLMEVTTYAYDAVGNLTSLSTPYGNTVSYTHDASDRVVSMSDVIGTIRSYTYDANSNMLSSTDALGNPTQYLYDVLNRLTTITAPLGQTAQYAYDNNSNVVSTVDGEGGITTLGYDALNRMISETFPGGLTTSCTFDPVGNLLSILDARGNPTTFLYDVMDRKTRTTYADGSFRQCVYDVAGNMISLQDQNGASTTYAYDGLNRLTNRSFPDGTSDAFVYDNSGRLIAATNAAATVSLTYDNAGRILSEVLNGKTTSNSYNVPARVVTSTLPGGQVITSALNARLQPVTVATGGTPLVTRTYDAASRLISKTLDNGISSSYGYDNNSRVISALDIRAGTLVAGENYTYDDRGFVSTVETPHHSIGSQKHQYDATTRLTGYKQGELVGGNIPAPVTQTEFVFDPVGNRNMVTKDGVPSLYTSNSINAYTSISGSVPVSPTYDANGNMLSDGSRAFTFDYKDQLTGAMDVATTAAYLYDAFGRRIQKTVNGAVTKYFYNGGAVVEERDGADAVRKTMINMNDERDVISFYDGPEERYFPHVSLGNNMIALSDKDGHMVERYGYDPFGMPTVYDSAYVPLVSSAHNVNPYYRGNELHGENPLYESDGRVYNPLIGRYLQQDPSSMMGNAPDLRNGYSYAANNPASFSSGTPKKLVNSKFVVRELADPGVHLSGRKGWDGTIKGTMADDDWNPNSSAMPGSPIGGLSIKGGRNYMGAQRWRDDPYAEDATNIISGTQDRQIQVMRGVAVDDGLWSSSSTSRKNGYVTAADYHYKERARFASGPRQSTSLADAGAIDFSVGARYAAAGEACVWRDGSSANSGRRISDVRIVHPPGTPPGTWRLSSRDACNNKIVVGGENAMSRGIRDIRIVHPPGTPPGTWKTGYNPRDYCVQYQESDWDFASKSIRDVRIVHPPGTPPGTWKTGGRSIKDIRIVHPPGTPLGMAINEKGLPGGCGKCKSCRRVN